MDLTGNLLSETDAGGNTTTYAYNSCGWLTEETAADARFTTTTYDAFGEPIESSIYEDSSYLNPSRVLFTCYSVRGQTSAEGARESGSEEERINYSYDHAGNLTRAEQVTRGGNPLNNQKHVDLSYDSLGRLTLVSSTMNGGLTPDYETSYAYYDSGELALRVTPASSATYDYDVSGRLVEIEDTLTGGEYVFTWDSDFRLVSYALPGSGGNIDYTYYGEGLVETQASYSYAYDAAGKRETMVVSAPLEGWDEETFSYEYDSLGRLAYFDVPEGELWENKDIAYSYDKVGNLKTKEVDGPGGTVYSYSYDEMNRITTGPDGDYTYDLYGNLEKITDEEEIVVASYGYDTLSRPVVFSDGETTVNLSYDPLNRLQDREQGEATVSFRYDGTSSELVQEVSGEVSVADYALTPAGTHLAQKREGELSYLGLSPHTDISFSLGSDGVLSGGRIYDPYGNLLSDTVDSSLGYQEDYTDPTSGMVWMGARWYSPELARFVSEDPLSGDPTEPLSRNPYLYCEDDPINSFDPTGMKTQAELEKAIADTQEAIAQVDSQIFFCVTHLIPVPRFLLNWKSNLQHTLDGLLAEYYAMLDAEGDSGDSASSGDPPTDPAEAALQEIIDFIENNRNVMLEGSIGAIVAAAIDSDNLDEFLKNSDIDLLDKMTVEQKTRLWRGVKQNLCPGYTEMTFDGKYLELNLYVGGGKKVRIFRVDAYSGQSGAYEFENNRGAIPHGVFRLTYAQDPLSNQSSFGDYVIRLEPTEGTKAMIASEGFYPDWYKEKYGYEEDLYKRSTNEGNYLIHEDAGAKGTHGCIGVLNNQLDNAIMNVANHLAIDRDPTTYSNTYLFVDYNDNPYQSPSHPGNVGSYSQPRL
ncbi:MAG: RHS repeat-associated core domain-containing protein [Actinomycetota bacterium]|nr:RHS repeat-associated core domain-containing protein [Actinomycetota bacterium]